MLLCLSSDSPSSPSEMSLRLAGRPIQNDISMSELRTELMAELMTELMPELKNGD